MPIHTARLVEFRVETQGSRLRATLVLHKYPGRIEYARVFYPSEFGEWQHAVLARVEPGKGEVMIVTSGPDDDEKLVKLGTSRGNAWFELDGDLRAEPVDRATPYELALAFINSKRGVVQRPLDPAAAGWSEDDVFAEARRIGWTPAWRPRST